MFFLLFFSCFVEVPCAAKQRWDRQDEHEVSQWSDAYGAPGGNPSRVETTGGSG